MNKQEILGVVAFSNIWQYKVRYYKEVERMNLPDAVESTINDCIREGILGDFLRKNRAEVLDVSIFEYNAEEEIRKYKIAQQELWREQGLVAGYAEGHAKGHAEGHTKGYTEGKKNAYISLIVSFANEISRAPECLKEMLEKKDEEALDVLVKLAAKATSVEEIMNAVK